MTIETINKRIEGKTKEIEKLEKKLERIRKAQLTNWEVNPYWYTERDLSYTTHELETARKSLAEYQNMLVQETEKANSRNIPVILEFLDMWKDRVRTYYTESLPAYLEEREEWYEYDKQHVDWMNHCRSLIEDRDERLKQIKEKEAEHRTRRSEFYSKWNWLITYIEHKDQLNYEKLDKDLQREADAKYDFIIERTNAITGTITDASDLKIGAKGDLNGIIVGERGAAKVQTIGAGGYNIQCFHFRTLIHAVK